MDDKELAKVVYSMKLGDMVHLNHKTRLIRVPGGWAFVYIEFPLTGAIGTTYIPYNNEFINVWEEMQGKKKDGKVIDINKE